MKQTKVLLTFHIQHEPFRDFIVRAVSSNYLSKIDFPFPIPSDVPLLKTIKQILPPDFTNSHGQLTQNGVTCSFQYDGVVLHIQILRKPFWVTVTQIENGLQEEIEKNA